MAGQLEADVVRACAAACEQVKAYRVGAPDLVEDVTRFIDGVLRFVEPDWDLTEARRAVLERLESTMLLMDRATASAGEGRAYRAAETARAHAVEAINHLQAEVLKQGCVNATGDRVGLGKAGDPIR